MRSLKTIITAGLLALSLAPAAGQQTQPAQLTPAELEANKKVATAFFRQGITPAERIAMLDPNYVRHNPVFRRYALQNKLSDYEAFKALVGGAGRQSGAGRQGAAPQAGPQPPADVPVHVVVGACDVVTIIHKNFRQDPTLPAGNFYETFTFDTFRVRNGKLLEHWDGATLPAAPPAGAPSAN